MPHGITRTDNDLDDEAKTGLQINTRVTFAKHKHVHILYMA